MAPLTIPETFAGQFASRWLENWWICYLMCHFTFTYFCRQPKWFRFLKFNYMLCYLTETLFLFEKYQGYSIPNFWFGTTGCFANTICNSINQWVIFIYLWQSKTSRLRLIPGSWHCILSWTVLPSACGKLTMKQIIVKQWFIVAVHFATLTSLQALHSCRCHSVMGIPAFWASPFPKA